MKLAVVVQRYGADINGGAELHARYIAEHLARHADVRVLTTCAHEYLTWRNEYPAGADAVNGIAVERFPVEHERDEAEFGLRSDHVFYRRHSLNEELEWLDSEGPASPALIARIRGAGDEFDYVVLFCARYYHAYYGARAVPHRAVLVPTMERDPALGLIMFGPIFRGVRGIMYNSYEEQTLIHAAASNGDVPGVVVGIGSEIPATAEPRRALAKFGLDTPYVVYVGRIDANKGCAELFDYFVRYAAGRATPPTLVLIGKAVLDIPPHPRIRHLGFVDDQDKFDVIAGAAALVMPSYYESLSMVALEAWALGTPVVANARCDVLLGQCLRSNAGLYYASSAEFGAVVDRVLDDRALAAQLGGNGRQFYDENYSWPVIERKYLDMFAQLSSNPPPHRMEKLPGWLARRQRSLRPAAQVLEELPSGAAA
ncbi:MAG: hexosyltransferase [Acidobacteria bacterium]|nr:MAG: hexosyltransferase [Acidobacteriota bacterium]